jgi:hypothetical protein
VQEGKKRKLHGRAFYESIGSPKLVLAPMVEQSEFVGFLNPRRSPFSGFVADAIVFIGMAVTLPLVSPARPAARSPSVYAHVPFENVWRDKQISRCALSTAKEYAAVAA